MVVVDFLKVLAVIGLIDGRLILMDVKSDYVCDTVNLMFFVGWQSKPSLALAAVVIRKGLHYKLVLREE